MSTSEEVELEKSKFDQWREEFEVHQDFPEDLFNREDFEEKFIWTELQDEVNAYSWLVTGYEKYDPSSRCPVVGYFVSTKPWVGESGRVTDVITSMMLDCSACQDSWDEEDGSDDCEECFGERETLVEFY